MADALGRLALPASAREDYREASSAYADGQGLADDFFDVDDQAEAMSRFSLHLGSLVQQSLDSGVDRDGLTMAMVRAFPLAADEVRRIVSSVAPAPQAAAPSAAIDFSRATPDTTRACPQCAAAAVLGAAYCPACGSPMPELTASDLLPIIAELQHALESRGESVHLPQTKILSDSFMTRAFAVYGHSLVAGLIVGLPVYLIYFFVLLVTLNAR